MGFGDQIIDAPAPVDWAQSALDKMLRRVFSEMAPREHYQKHQGHRQNFTEIQIVSING